MVVGSFVFLSIVFLPKMKVISAVSAAVAVSSALVIKPATDVCAYMDHEKMLMQMKNVPGAGMDLEKAKEEAFKKSFKDGYFKVNCLNDEMRQYGDKHGGDKSQYNAPNVSIVRYEQVVPKEDQKQMTPSVCYNFCRSMKNMNFFGLINGRNCYCGPHFQPSGEGDSGSCDKPCDGDNTVTCGGQSKSDIYAMHECGDSAKKLEASLKDLEKLGKIVEDFTDGAGKCAKGADAGSAILKEWGVEVGDPHAGNHAQNGRETSAFYKQMKRDGEKFMKQAKEVTEAGTAALGGPDSVEGAKAIDDSFAAADRIQGAIYDYGKDLDEDLCKINEDKNKPAALDKYRAAMQLQSKDRTDSRDNNQTCGGELLGKVHGGSELGCAQECDNTVFPSPCVGFQFYNDDKGKNGACYLFKKVESVTYYSEEKCAGENQIKCMLKISQNTGLALKVQELKKCALNEAMVAKIKAAGKKAKP